jgi:hypothetical protein
LPEFGKHQTPVYPSSANIRVQFGKEQPGWRAPSGARRRTRE